MKFKSGELGLQVDKNSPWELTLMKSIPPFKKRNSFEVLYGGLNSSANTILYFV